MTMSMREACPECGSQQSKRNGHIHNGKQNQNHQCKACGRQFVLVTINRVISEEHRTLVERLLCEKISLHGICRTIGVSIRWLMDFMVACFAAVLGFGVQFETSQTVNVCKIPDHPSRTVLGMPNCVIRLSTAHFTNASVRWVFRPRAQSRPPNNRLKRNIVFSAMLCRVYPLRIRHVERPYLSICCRI